MEHLKRLVIRCLKKVLFLLTRDKLLLKKDAMLLNEVVECLSCGIEFNPSYEKESIQALKIPMLYANNYCSRLCMSKYINKINKGVKNERM